MGNVVKTISEVFVYHDETKEAGNQKLQGHILLFVPREILVFTENPLFGEASKPQKVYSLEMLKSEICKLRKKYNADHKFHFKKISGRTWKKYNEAERELMLLGVDALRSKGTEVLKSPLYCKMAVIFFENPTPNSISIYGGPNKNEKVLRFHETILRMLLKGAVHYLYDKNNQVKILKLINDGQPYHRNLSDERILLRLINEQLAGSLRNYVEIPIEAEIIHLESDHKNYDYTSEEYIHANILQLADMLLGSVIQSCLKNIKWQNFKPKIGSEIVDKKSIIAYPVKEMLDKSKKRKRNFRYSGHYKSFSISEAYIINKKWEFKKLTSKEIEKDSFNKQISLLALEWNSNGNNCE